MSEAGFESLARVLPDALALVEASGRIVSVNPAAAALLERPIDDLVGEDLTAVAGEDVLPYLASCARSTQHLPGVVRAPGGPLRAHGCVYRPASESSPALVLLRMVRQETASRRFLQLNQQIEDMAREIRERKRAEEQVKRLYTELQESLRLRELERVKSEFLAGMSHELRTPLNSIMGFTEVLLEEIPGPLLPEQKRQLSYVHSASEHLLHLIEELLDLSRIETGRSTLSVAEFDFPALLEEVVESTRPLFERRGLTVELGLGEERVQLTSDRMKLRQVLLNLLGNAAKFTETGGARVDWRATVERVRVEVRDTGQGIAPEMRARLFQPFQKGVSLGGREGAGLGLYLSRKLVSMLGGEIDVESGSGVGAAFYFTIPRSITTPSATS